MWTNFTESVLSILAFHSMCLYLDDGSWFNSNFMLRTVV